MPIHTDFWLIHAATQGRVELHRQVMDEMPMTWVYAYVDRYFASLKAGEAKR